MSARAAARALNVNFSTISRLTRRFDGFGTTTNCPHARRPHVTTSAQDRYIQILHLCDHLRPAIATADKSFVRETPCSSMTMPDLKWPTSTESFSMTKSSVCLISQHIPLSCPQWNTFGTSLIRQFIADIYFWRAITSIAPKKEWKTSHKWQLTTLWCLCSDMSGKWRAYWVLIVWPWRCDPITL